LDHTTFLKSKQEHSWGPFGFVCVGVRTIFWLEQSWNR